MVDSRNAALGIEAGDQRDQGDRGFLLSWVLATSVGLVVGGAVAAAVEEAIRRSWYRFDMPESEEVFKVALAVGVMLFIWGAVIGTMQWTVLRRRLPGSGWWAPATAAGWCLAGVVAGVFSAVVNEFSPSGSEGITIVKIAVGFIPFLLWPLFQWLGLRRRVAAAVQWLWGSVGALFLAGVGAFAVVRGAMVGAGWLTPYDFPSIMAFALFGVVMGPIYGAITGVVMVRLLRRQRTTS